jgi:hypothetical protein
MQNWNFTFSQLAIHFGGRMDELKIPVLVIVGEHDIPYLQVTADDHRYWRAKYYGLELERYQPWLQRGHQHQRDGLHAP